MALARLFELTDADVRVATPALDEFLEKHPPEARCVIVENSSWSCAHGVERWRSDCGCHTGGGEGWNQKWRGPMREAFDALASAVDELYETEVSRYGDPWRLRNEAIELYKCGLPLTDEEIREYRKSFFAERFSGITDASARMLSSLVEMQRMRMFMYTSCAWFFSDVSGVEARQMLSYALRAAEIAEEVSGRKDYIAPLMENLKKAKGNTKDYPDAASVVTNASRRTRSLRSLRRRKKKRIDWRR